MKLKIIYCYFFFNSCMEKKEVTTDTIRKITRGNWRNLIQSSDFKTLENGTLLGLLHQEINKLISNKWISKGYFSVKAPDFSEENQLNSAIEELKVPFVQKNAQKKIFKSESFKQYSI